jgi:hypothetical protein
VVGGLVVLAISALGLLRVLSNALVGDISDESVLMVGSVGHNLDTAVRKVDTVRSLKVAVGILGLALVEAGSSVGVLDAVLVLKGLGSLILVLLLGVVGRGSRAVRGGSGAVRGGVVSRGHGSGDSHDGEESNEALKKSRIGKNGSSLVVRTGD